MKVEGKKRDKSRMVLKGSRTASTATAHLLEIYSKPEIIAVDTKGAITSDRPDLTPSKQYLASLNLLAPGRAYSLHDALIGADVVIGVSKAGMLSPEDIKVMNDNAIVFALANPEPEIMPELALSAGAAIVATGRSDFPNQVNNVLAFPGIFRGALDNGVKEINVDHKIAAAMAIASLVPNPSPTEIIPNPLNPKVASAVASVIR